MSGGQRLPGDAHPHRRTGGKRRRLIALGTFQSFFFFYGFIRQLRVIIWAGPESVLITEVESNESCVGAMNSG